MKIQKILHPTDFSDSAKAAFDHALFLARQFDAELHVLHAVVVYAGDPFNPQARFPEAEEVFERLNEQARSEMAGLIEKRTDKALRIRDVHRRGIAPDTVILEYVEEEDIDLVVMGTHGRRGPVRFLMGSVAERVVRLAPSPVLTIGRGERAGRVEAIETLLVPVDFSDHSRAAVRAADALAGCYGAKLQLLHVVEEQRHPHFYGRMPQAFIMDRLPDLQQESTKALGDLAEEIGIEAAWEAQVRSGSPGHEIVEAAEGLDADMIVLATHGLSGLKRVLLGSVAEQVVRLALVPVWTVKSFGKSLLD